MNEDRTESFESPLEAVLSETPTEAPPADLKQRCLQAVRDADAARAPRKPALWPIVWKGAVGLAAAFVVMVVAIAVMPGTKRPVEGSGMVARAPEQTPPTQVPDSSTMAKAGGTVTHWSSAEADGTAEPPVGQSVIAGDEAAGARRAYAPDAEDGVVANTRFRDTTADVRYADAGRPGGAPAAAPALPQAEDAVSAGGGAYNNSLYAPVDRKVEAWEMEGAAGRPWRDESGERQKVTTKEMKLAVDDIEDAHERAASVITKADGYVDTEEMRVNERGEGESVIQARVPIEGLDGVVAQLRELGKVLELRGESEDRTNEYYAQGQSIRELAEREIALVAKYEQEENRARKQRLLWEIQAVRQQIRAQKAPLKELSNETHFAFLSLTLTQAVGPKQFVNRLSRSVPTAGAWLAISAIFWVPVLLVVIAVWRRVAGRTASNG